MTLAMLAIVVNMNWVQSMSSMAVLAIKIVARMNWHELYGCAGYRDVLAIEVVASMNWVQSTSSMAVLAYRDRSL